MKMKSALNLRAARHVLPTLRDEETARGEDISWDLTFLFFFKMG